MNKEVRNIQVLLISVIQTAMNFRCETIASLSSKIGVTEKYFNALLECRKEINFLLLAKIEHALNIRFEVKAIQ